MVRNCHLHRSRFTTLVFSLALAFAFPSCLKVETEAPAPNTSKKLDFDISVTREGEAIGAERRGITKGSVVDESDNMLSTMDKDIPFGLVGVDFNRNALVVDNAMVTSDGSDYSGRFNFMSWDRLNSKNITFSAYYPFVPGISYGDDYKRYSIPYAVEHTDAGPMVSKTVEMAFDYLNRVPLEFQHITNDIGYCIFDVTPDKELQGLVHLRKVTAHNVASAGVFINDIAMNRGRWHLQAYYRDVVVFEGDEKVGVGSQNEKFIGMASLVDRLAESHRYYSIPDDIEMGKQYVEVVYDVEGFTLNGFKYPPIEGVHVRYPLYGLLPDNIFVYGRQYTFHIGIDLSSVYSEITFSPTVAGWETKIFENNEVF